MGIGCIKCGGGGAKLSIIESREAPDADTAAGQAVIGLLTDSLINDLCICMVRLKRLCTQDRLCFM